ncbi:MAG: recombinase family protein [Sterolibacteriaceae bacterium]|uniref:Recombinase family protein n=1 Tax=Candidatus Methylophosphatis roskildensis TaxID=2899263 RepID=A0A9D7HM21_9PROT|nr:recombinase family protein [Candidatus Methylophosphatis roskildensis]
MYSESPKVSTNHLRRDAYLYVRQSTLRQVLENTESTKRQYALQQRAVALGWPIERIHTIDNDLGRSGASSRNRDGFQHLVSEVAMGHAGIVLGLEVSRLARNNADWHRLLELAAMSQTLICDEDGVYDPAHFNDRLLLGLKGTMSEAELHILKARLQGGIRNKASRGELELALPVGLVYTPSGAVVLDPDAQIRSALQFVFDTYRQSGSACAVVRRFEREGVRFPRRLQRGLGKGDVLWGSIDHRRVVEILHNPRYAGAFVYGRVHTARDENLRPHLLQVPREQWHTLICNAHPGYIDWDEFERNQLTLKHNAPGRGVTGRGSPPREGVGLLQGRIICGRCGARMSTRYSHIATTTVPYYQCLVAAVRRGAKACQSLQGASLDAAIGAQLLDKVAPAALALALQVQDEIAARIGQADELRSKQLERARYEADLARRRFLKVDPDNRLVADALEADWNACLRQISALQQSHDQQRQSDAKALDSQARERVMAIAADFPRVWHDPRTDPIERKRMLALLIEDVTIVADRKEITAGIRWRGGQTSSIRVARSLPIAQVRKTPPQVVIALDQLLETCSDTQAAKRLNEMGYRNWRQEPFTYLKVRRMRIAYKLRSRYERLRARGLQTAEEIAQRLGVCVATVSHWANLGILEREIYGGPSHCLYVMPEPGTVVAPKIGRPRKLPSEMAVAHDQQEIV